MKLLARRPSAATVIALIALFVAVGGPAEAARLINGKQIKRGTITSKQVKDRSLTTSDLSRGTRASLLKTPARSVGAAQLLEGSVGAAQLAPGSITAAALTPNSVSSANIVDKQVGNADLGDASVTAGKIGTSAVRKSELAGNAVGSSELSDGAVTTEKLAAGAATGTTKGTLIPVADTAGALPPVDFGPLGGQSPDATPRCETSSALPAPGLVAGETTTDDHLLLTLPADWPAELVVSVRPASGGTGVTLTACNVGRLATNPTAATFRLLGIDAA